jgi:hypothetical protein
MVIILAIAAAALLIVCAAAIYSVAVAFNSDKLMQKHAEWVKSQNLEGTEK